LPKAKFELRHFFLPPTLLDLLWNKWHILAIELFVGPVDVFFASDWTQPPIKKAKIITTIHDLAILKFPAEFTDKILKVQKRRLNWLKKEANMILCDSQATKNDAVKILKIAEAKLQVVYPGV